MKITPNAKPVTFAAPSIAAVQDEATLSPADAPRAQRAAAANDGHLQTARGQLRDMSEVDRPFVSAMQEALKAGRLEVDTAQLAQAMMDFYRK
ncbi:hypothetical protein N4G40_03425 [Pantoea eucrina]|uniref:Negative regulator of flagellin synthesis n=1 Tax=Pantoea eucrina TaxID=472693 RepID=A0ABU5LBM4_9GAMM|nr:flagellar biosynthesis anti-sigma factor FlgM [Pantoea eucrina]MDZ7277334.1 hypothetical protein [Pantoea eucrina]